MSKSKKLARLRTQAYEIQARRCYYCEALMWVNDPSKVITALGIRPRAARLFQCTAEHLRARCEGGGDAPGNVVAACRFCNMQRHRTKNPLDPDQYKEKVSKAVRSGRWPTALGMASPRALSQCHQQRGSTSLLANTAKGTYGGGLP